MLHASEAAGLSHAFEVLLTVRVELHRVTGGRSDRLLLELQDEVAERLGHGDADQLMADVAAAAAAIRWVGDGAYRRIRRALRDRRWRWSTGRSRPDVVELGDGIMLDDDRLFLAEDVPVGDDPVLPLRVAAAAAARGAYMDRLMLQHLASGSPPMPDPWPDEAREHLEALMSTGPDLVQVVEDLDQAGLFVRLIPEWGPCRHRPQRNAYHRFTVDRHLLEATAEARRLRHMVDRPDLLVVGALLHDIGKGYPGDHTEVGMGLVRTIATRMGYPEPDVEMLVAMVEHHLLLPDVATRRDLEDSGTILAVAQSLKSQSLLRLLAALTEADSIATGSSAWSRWKADLVGDLVARVDYVLAGGDAGQDGGVCGLSWSATPFARQGEGPRGSGEPAPQLGVRVQPIGYVHTGPCPYNATNSSFCTNASLPIYCKLGLLTDPEMRPTCVSGEHNRLRCTRPLSLACGPHTDGACCR